MTALFKMYPLGIAAHYKILRKYGTIGFAEENRVGWVPSGSEVWSVWISVDELVKFVIFGTANTCIRS